jgi:hypothetical protein|tara:strand:+ start:334 stop:696 length:363 start_codon:yes stop_codon:yes gene_type:complete
MKYEKEILISLLKSRGINHNLKAKIKPSKHPYMKRLEMSLKAHNLDYIYFHETDSLAITEVNYHPYLSLHNTLMMPSKDGISILLVMNSKEKMEELVCEMENTLDVLIPQDIEYSIVGVL